VANLRAISKISKLGTLAALSMFAIHAHKAFSFDFYRFSGENSGSPSISQLASEQNLRGTEDEFVLAPSGILSKFDKVRNLNIIVSKIDKSQPVEVIGQEPSNEIDHSHYMNTIGSEKSHSRIRETNCGPSAMKPSEIEDLVGATAEAYGVDRKFATAIAWVESRFDQIRNSPKGARGPMQLMPETARDLGVSDICDPVANIDGGVRHLRSLLDEFKNPLLVAAAYNAGKQAVYDNGGIPPYGETVRYVSAVINHQLGLQIRPDSHTAPPNEVSTNEQSLSGEKQSGGLGARASRFVNGVMHF
jgi:hypothetical protein